MQLTLLHSSTLLQEWHFYIPPGVCLESYTANMWAYMCTRLFQGIDYKSKAQSWDWVAKLRLFYDMKTNSSITVETISVTLVRRDFLAIPWSEVQGTVRVHHADSACEKGGQRTKVWWAQLLLLRAIIQKGGAVSRKGSTWTSVCDMQHAGCSRLRGAVKRRCVLKCAVKQDPQGLGI